MDAHQTNILKTLGRVGLYDEIEDYGLGVIDFWVKFTPESATKENP